MQNYRYYISFIYIVGVYQSWRGTGIHTGLYNSLAGDWAGTMVTFKRSYSVIKAYFYFDSKPINMCHNKLLELLYT